MNSFPKIKKSDLQSAFDKLKELYALDLKAIVMAAQEETSGSMASITYSANISIDTQIGQIRNRIGRVAAQEGLKLFVKIIENLFDKVNVSPIGGVTEESLLSCTRLNDDGNGSIYYTNEKIWNWGWKLIIDEEEDCIELCLRGKDFVDIDVVPEYIVNNFNQAISAFSSKRNGATMSLLSISLEGVLRDALSVRGYDYQPHIPTQDSYSKSKMQICSDSNGYRVTFPSQMPKSKDEFLKKCEDGVQLEVDIKRVKWNNKWILQISDLGDLLDFWSSNQIATPGQIRIGGLGTALSIARNDENIIDISIFPEDFDIPIKAVRNNLIHLSGAAMEKVVYNSAPTSLTLREYIDSKERVFDATMSIGELINDLYLKISKGEL